MDDRTVKEDLLIGGLDDWADAGWVVQVCRRSGLTAFDQLRSLAMGVIVEVLVEGLMVPGELTGHGHRRWECSTGQAIERIVQDWLREWPNEVPTPGAVVWLANTEAGNEIGRAVLAREKRRP